ncbi:hypothetical protein Bca52824_096002 [Brassica carinata]|uniref:DEAH11/12 RRM domain-containing protein n=1 Tax=Brassica carinata TaxID=52824 RepID=A0A8X7NZ58_BRACI|nr:hypothetical protein Bca52824_096002 [Brassica carinata]
MDRGEMFKMPSFPSVTATIRWLQRESTGRGVLKCSSGDVHSIFAGTSDIVIGTRYARFEIDQRTIIGAFKTGEQSSSSASIITNSVFVFDASHNGIASVLETKNI